jgi:hypothetical protein
MGNQPLSLVAMQEKADQSDCLERYPIKIAICPRCNHCFNYEFDRHIQQYSGAGCRMWNNGMEWQEHVDHVAKVAAMHNAECIIEIGAGDGEFLEKINSPAVKIAIDPAGSVMQCGERGIHYERAYFDATEHIPEGCGNLLIIMRHLLEHMANPRAFMDEIANVRRDMQYNTHVLIEVPCIHNALNRTRLEDWTYEHPQHFTETSLELLTESVGFRGITSLEYADEVLLYTGQLEQVESEEETYLDNFAKMSLMASRIGGQLAGMESVAYWGGAGKSAMFLNYLGVGDDALVVDSDPNKIGMYVPGTKIQIQDPTKLLIDHVDTIVVTTSWRAYDIAAEIRERNIPCNKLLTFERGNLVEVIDE